MGSPHTPSPGEQGKHPDAMQNNMQLSPQVLLSPDSLRPELPSRQLLFAYQHIFLADRKSALSPSLVGKKTIPRPIIESNIQTKSIMALRFDRLKDKLRVGWYGLSKDTISHSAVTTKPTMTATSMPDSIAFIWPTQTASQDGLYIRDDGDTVLAPTMNTTSSEEIEKITVVQTIIVTITKVITDMTLKTLTTTLFLSTCTTCLTTPQIDTSTNTTNSSDPTPRDLMTGIMYCSFTGRRNIYTLCPLVHADLPGMLTSAPAVVSSATPRVKNPFRAISVVVASLWNSVPGLGSVMQPKDHHGDCNCAGIRKKLDSAVDLVRVQQQLLDSQRAIINEQRKTLFLALETLANLTAVRAGGKAARERRLDLKI
ncbi:hypothetical protein F4859DRAFT_517739 [Xylaria cf. heliscus]|nr:hypothetical protein F4859DRAFT_517739 [Xylaria cf. heliscus]